MARRTAMRELGDPLGASLPTGGNTADVPLDRPTNGLDCAHSMRFLLGPARRAWRLPALAALPFVAFASGCADVSHDPGAAMTEAGPMPAPTSTAPTPVEPDFSSLECGEQNPVPAQGRLLTRLQYDNTVRDLFPGIVVEGYAHAFPPENQVLGFETNAEFHRASAWLTEGHMTAAEQISELVLGRLTEVLPCAGQSADEACAIEFIDAFGARAFRRPLLESERAPMLELFRQTSATQGFDRGIQLLIQAFLQSPQFLYRFDTDTSRPMLAVLPAVDEESFQVSNYEMASRLSYFLWNSMPDEELFAAAAAGQLATREQVEAQARRMLDDEKVLQTLSDFSRQWLGLDRLNAEMRLVPGQGELALGFHWQTSVDLFVQRIFFDGGDAATLMSSPIVYMNPTLANLYGVELPPEAGEYDFFAVEFEADRRSGLLTQPGLMAMLAHSDQSTPIQRGVFVLTNLLCQPPPPPPPSVDPTPPDPDPNATTRERFAQHTEDPTCAGCHSLIDPVGLAFETYDHLGRYRSEENGLPIDDSGTLPGTREEAIRGDFKGALELGQRLAGSQQLSDCLVTQWYRYGSGRVEQDVDLCSVARGRIAMFESGGNLRELLVALATSDAFMYRTQTVDVASGDNTEVAQ